MVNDIAAASSPAVIKLDIGHGAARIGRYVTLTIGLAVAGAALGVGIAIWSAVRPITDAVNEVREQAETARKANRPLTLSELRSFAGGGWRQVEAPPPPGGWAAFDPVAAVEWAQQIAHAWAADARLTRIDVSRVSAEGTANLDGSGEDTVGYRFVSPERVAEWERKADREVNAQVAYELMMQVSRQQVTASVQRGRPSSGAVPPAFEGLSLRDLLARAQASPRFIEHPFYAGFITHIDREGWVWRLQSLSGRDSLPRVRARDAAVYPYR